MNILFFSRLFYPHIGGVEIHTYKLSKKIINNGHKVIVVTELHDTSLVRKETIHGIELYRVPVGTEEKKKKYEIWIWLWRNRRLIKSADIVHCHDVYFWYLPFRFLYPFKKVFTTFHGYETFFPVKKKAVIVRKISELLSFGNICIGEYIKKWYKTNPSFVSYGGVDLPQKIKDAQIGKKLKILFFGRIAEDNGIFIYAEVLNILKNKGIEYEFIALGDGKDKKEFTRFGEVKGFIKHPEKFIEEADIVLSSSYLSILQAFSYKKLVVSTYSNQLKKDYLLMTPFKKWIICNQDPIQLAHEIIKFRNSPSSFDMKRERAYEWVKEQTWEKLANKYLSLWRLQ